MKTLRYGVDPDPKTVEVRMAALAREGLTAESFGITDLQLRYHIDPSRAQELRELIKQDPAGRAALAKFLPGCATPARPLSANGHAATSLKDVPQTRLTPIEAKTPRKEIDLDQINGAIQRGAAADKGSRAESNRNGRAFRQAPQVITRRASDIKPEPIAWLWKDWLARGKLHIIAGVPETGKTTIALSYAAIVSSGGEWPDGTRATVGSVLIWTAEDGPSDTLVPRLIRMGADLDRIHFIEEAIPPGAKSRPFNPSIDMPALVEKAKAIGDVDLLILDPVVAAVPMTRNSHNNAESRNGMQPVVDLAKAADIAVLGVGHLTKGTVGKDPLERINGSGAFGALPRLVMGAAKNEADGEDKPERIMVRIKSNIGPSGGGFGYHIETAPLLERPDIEATRIVWELPLEGTARELLAEAERLDEDAKASKVAEAKYFLKIALEKGERRQREIMVEAEAAGISERTLRRAAKGAVGKRKAASGWIWWALP